MTSRTRKWSPWLNLRRSNEFGRRVGQRFCDALPQILRPVGLRILTAVNKAEPRKVVVYESAWAVLVRSVIHVVPAFVTIGLVVLNLEGYFIGRSLQGQQGNDAVKSAALQFAAKIQELFVLSSLGSIIVHLLRERLLFGEGVPFGLLGSDKAFSQVSFFWSIDFWGGILSYKKARSRHRFDGFILVVFLVYGGVVALMAGPATAILMIPRTLEWPVGGAMFQLNRTAPELWPAVLDATSVDVLACATTEQRLEDPQCPSGGFEAISRTFGRSFRPILYLQFDLDDDYLQKRIYAETANNGVYDSWVYTTHGPTADFQDAAVDFHTDALLYLRDRTPYYPWDAPPQYLDLAQTRLYQVETQVPLVRTICELQPTLTSDNETTIFSFAKFDRFHLHRIDTETGARIQTGDMKKLDVFEDLQRGLAQRNITFTRENNLVEVMSDLDHVVVPVELPSDLNGSSAIVYLRRAHNVPEKEKELAEQDPFHVMTCTVDARWVQGRSTQTYDSFNNMHQPHGGERDVTSNLVETKLGPATLDPEGLDDSHLGYLADIDRGQIRIHPDWFDALSPYVSDAELPGYPTVSAQPNRTTTERLLETRDIPNWIADTDDNIVRRSEVEVIIGSTFADGLSRSGLDSPQNFKGIIVADAKPGETRNIASSRELVHYGAPTQTFKYIDFPSEGRNISDMPMMTQEAIFTGYVMAAVSPFDYFCIILLLSHALLALGHTAYCCFHHRFQFRTHDTWDTIPQLVALSQQSAPAAQDILSNVCGGIQSFKTAGTVAVIEYSENAVKGSEELQLVVRDGFRQPGRRRRGGVPAGAQGTQYQPMIGDMRVPAAGTTYGLKQD